MALTWVGLIAGGTACGAVPRPIERPRLTVRDVQLRPTAQGYDLIVDFSAVNPNETALHGAAADWQVSVAGVPRARGRIEPGFVLNARGTVETSLVAHVPPGAAARIREVVAHALAPMRVDGVIHWTSAAGDVATPFSRPACAGR